MTYLNCGEAFELASGIYKALASYFAKNHLGMDQDYELISEERLELEDSTIKAYILLAMVSLNNQSAYG